MENSSAKERQLARRVAAERKAAGSRKARFSVELRRDAAALVVASSQPRGEVAKALGLSRTVLQSWVMSEHGRVRKPRRAVEKPRAKKPTLQRFTIASTEAAARREALDLVFPSGARVVGLTLSQVRALLGGGQ